MVSQDCQALHSEIVSSPIFVKSINPQPALPDYPARLLGRDGRKARPGVSAPAYALSSTRARPLPPHAPQWVRLNSLPPPQAFGKSSLGIAVPPEQDGVPLFITACGYCSCSGSASGPSPRAWAWAMPGIPMAACSRENGTAGAL